jgi:hypothetical protein
VSLTSDGSLAYEAVGADTALARDLRELLKPTSTGKPFVGNVSIYGSWGDRPRRIVHQGEAVETADDLIIEAIDFTYNPGIETTTVRVETAPGEFPISETAPIEVAMTDETPAVTEDADAPIYASMTVSAGPWSVNISQYQDYDGDIDIDPAVLMAAVQAAVDQLMNPAPPDGEATADDNEMESAQPKENAVADTTPEVAEATPAPRNLTDADVAAIATALKETAPAQTATAETATETDPAPAAPLDVAALKESLKVEILAALVQEGHAKPTRKGYGVKETAEVSDDEAWKNRGENFAAAFGLTPASVGLEAPDAA